MVHILIVDDEPNLASSLALLLQRSGYQTTVVHDGRAALEALRTTTFDLALLDLNKIRCWMAWRFAVRFGHGLHTFR
jgi:DNA-binding response OmpR family regulator